MANSKLRRHPAFGIPGALSPAFLPVYPVAPIAQRVDMQPSAILSAAFFGESDTTQKRTTWPNHLTAFAARHHREGP